MKKLIVFLTVIALLAVGLLLPAAAVADEPQSQSGGLASASVVNPVMPLDGTWVYLDEIMVAPAFFTGNWTWDKVPLVRFTITDYFVVSDQFQVYDNGGYVATTPAMPDWDTCVPAPVPLDPYTSPPWTADADTALADGRFSCAVLYIGVPGPHSITIRDIHIPPVSVGGPPFADGTVAFKAEAREVDVDIKPGSYPNAINLKSKGVIPVAVLGSDTFDVGMIKPATLMFAGAPVVKWAYEDVNGDGWMDLISFYKTQDTMIKPGQPMATIWGLLKNGIPFWGRDSIVTVPPE